MKITIIKPGILTTIQDLGRQAFLARAVPVSGAMDTLSARIANKVLGNADNAAVIEFTYGDASFTANTDLLIAYAGDGTTLNASAQIIPAERPVLIPAGTTIDLTANISGCRTYIAIAGGWDVPEIMGSRSTYITAGFGGLEGRALKAGDVLQNAGDTGLATTRLLKTLKGYGIKFTNWSLLRRALLPADQKTIRVIPAPEFTWFSGVSIYNFLTTPYKLDMRSNRMGYHLDGAHIGRLKTDELLSTAVVPGTIQVTGEGKLILLMADCQTTGGYPRIAQVAAVDLPLCGQLKPGDTIYFKEIGRHEAEKLYLEQELQLQQLTTAVSSKF